ncbi:putative chitinase [Streptacidiphilus sp. MAP12-16]|uniref:glycoside hydrolase family 19 protein n=1 Tax=Streptacidiphilus sp. MAP12-16 TaxID=3156300 RepID=UPI003512B3C9
MSRLRIVALMAVAVLFGALAVTLPVASASATTCSASWSSGAVYTGGMDASYNGHEWQAKWWTQGDTPGGSVGVWADEGSCTGGSGGGSGGGTGSGCTYPAWVAGHAYVAGDIVQYSNGNLYRASHDNPGYDPTISTWYWDPYTCAGGTGGGGSSGGFVVSQAQFDQMFPNRNSFYTYAGLTAALSAYPGFATTGSATVQAQEAAAFLANVGHETGGLVYIVEQNTANYSTYCDRSQSYGCPAGQSAYYGRGPMQLSWNFNYKAAGDALGIDLLDNPNAVQTDAAVAWKTGLWYWDTQNGPGTMTAHNAMVNGAGFGQTIRSINGSLECNGNNTAEMQDRVALYQQFTQILGVPAGSNLTC